MVVQRLDRWIASHTQYSRKEARQLVRSGGVTVDGAVATNPGEHVPEDSQVMVEGRLLRLQKYLYLMMNKPKGVVSATQDNIFSTVIDILPEEYRRADVFPAGRLDRDTEGFLILTNDGQFAHRVTSPNYRVPKMYYAILEPLDKNFSFDKVIAEFSHGIVLSDEEKTSPAKLKILQTEPFPAVELVIYEGMYHQVKRMFAHVGAEVSYLKRVRIGQVSLDSDLVSGSVRPLTSEEIRGVCASCTETHG